MFWSFYLSVSFDLVYVSFFIAQNRLIVERFRQTVSEACRKWFQHWFFFAIHRESYSFWSAIENLLWNLCLSSTTLYVCFHLLRLKLSVQYSLYRWVITRNSLLCLPLSFSLSKRFFFFFSLLTLYFVMFLTMRELWFEFFDYVSVREKDGKEGSCLWQSKRK